MSLTSLSVSSVFFLLPSLALINYRGFCLPNSNQSTTLPWLLSTKLSHFTTIVWTNIRYICLILLYFRSINVNYSVVCTLVFLLLSPSSPPVCLLGFIFVFAFIITKISKLEFLPLICFDF